MEISVWNKDFPKITHFVDIDNVQAKPWEVLKAHPSYDAAKYHEDKDAAMKLVSDFLGIKENQKQLVMLKRMYPDAILLPVRAVEKAGKNRLPAALAKYISHEVNLKVDQNIYQSNKVHRTGAGEWHRFAFRPTFTGPVQKGKSYLMIDDVSTHGGTFSELRRHVESHGGKVVCAAALSLGGHGDRLAITEGLKHTLKGKYGKDELNNFLLRNSLYDGNFEQLTNPEAIALRKVTSLEKADFLIAAARHEGLALGMIPARAANEEKPKHEVKRSRHF